MSKGDVIMLTLQVGDGARDFEIKADKDGRWLDVKRGKRTVITVKTRHGGVVRSVEFDPAKLLVMDKKATESRLKVKPKSRQIALQLGEVNGNQGKAGGG